MAGFIENLLREGVRGGAGYLRGRRLGEEERRQRTIEEEERERQKLLEQAMIDLREARTEGLRNPEPRRLTGSEAEGAVLPFVGGEMSDSDILAEAMRAQPGLTEPAARSALESIRRRRSTDERLSASAERAEARANEPPRSATVSNAEGQARIYAQQAQANPAQEADLRQAAVGAIAEAFPDISRGEASQIVDDEFDLILRRRASSGNLSSVPGAELLAQPDAAPAPSAPPDPSGPGVPEDERIRQLIQEGKSDEEIARILRDEGY